MANKHTSESGSYDKSVEDSSHQDSKKFSNPIAKPKDDLWTDKTSINKPKDSADSTIG